MLRGGLLVFIVACAALVAAKRIPQVDNIQELLINIDSRYSDNLLEDANIDVPDLITKYRYPVEVHNVTTEDGYILQMHRIPYGRDANNVPNQRKPVVFVMHGLLCSSADFVLMGPGSGLVTRNVCGVTLSNLISACIFGPLNEFPFSKGTKRTSSPSPSSARKYAVKIIDSADLVIMGPGSGLAYLLAEEGFDVWMGNARGNYYSRKHVTLNPDAILNTAFWKFSWDEIGNIDLPTMIDYVLEVSGEERLHYVGHSQGTTSFFVLGSMQPEYNDKIISMNALAPVAYMAHNQNLLLNMLAPYSNDIENIASLVGAGEFLPHSILFTWAGEALCRDEVVFQPICSNILFLIGGWDEAQLNTTMMPVIFGHTPAGSSVRQLAHYSQGISGKGFRRYDQGSLLANYITYGSSSPPSYDLSKVTAPVFLHYSEGDLLAEVEDVDRLFEELGSKTLSKFLVPLSSFSHTDYMYGIDAKELVYDSVIDLIKAMDADAIDDHV